MPCVSGEVCGAYPSLQSKSVLEVLDKPLTNESGGGHAEGLTDRSRHSGRGGFSFPHQEAPVQTRPQRIRRIGEGTLQTGNQTLAGALTSQRAVKQ